MRDCAREILDGLRIVDKEGRRPPFDQSNLIFIAHSTGGIAVRYMLERFREAFHGKNVGLLLIASPSLGSIYANKLELLARFYNQQLGLQLRWGGESLDELDGRFKDLVHDDRKPFTLFGRECYEHYFILRQEWLPPWLNKILPNRRKLVDRLSAGRYFDEPRLIAETDHFTSVKPTSFEHSAHKQLVLFKKDFDEWLLRTERTAPSQPDTAGTTGAGLNTDTDTIRVVFPKVVQYPTVKFSVVNEGQAPIQITDFRVVVAAKVKDNHSGAEYLTGVRTELEFNLNRANEGDIRELLGHRVLTLGPKEIESFSLQLTIENAVALLDVEIEWVAAGREQSMVYHPEHVILVHAPAKPLMGAAAPGSAVILRRERAFELVLERSDFVPWEVPEYRDCRVWASALLRGSGSLLFGDVRRRWDQLGKLLKYGTAGPICASVAETALRYSMPDDIIDTLREWISQPRLIKQLGMSDNESYAVVIDRSLERLAKRG